MRKPLLLACTVLTAVVAASAADAQAAFTTYTRYDGMHRVTGTIAPDPDGSGPLGYPAVRNSYDAAGRLVKVEKGQISPLDTSWTNPGAAPASWTGFTPLETIDTGYDAMDRKITETTSAAGAAYTLTQYSYDGSGQLECTAVRTNPAAFAQLPASACTAGAQGSQGPDRITRNVYDPAGRLLKVQKAYGTALQQDYATFEYTPNGKQKAVIDANGNRAELSWDGFDRQKRWIFPSPTAPAPGQAGLANQADYEEYGYDADGNRTSLRKRDGSILTYSYDGEGRAVQKNVPASVSGAPGYSVFYGYDMRGLQTYARFGSASGPGIATDYDALGRILSTSTTMDGTTRTLSYSYDAHGNRTGITGSFGYGAAFTYDAADRMATLSDSSGSEVRIAYDRLGSRSAMDQGPNGATSLTNYGYDGIGRLQSLGHDLAGGAFDQSYGFAYNPASQMVTKTASNDGYASNTAYDVSRPYSVNGLNQYTAAGGATFGYDLNGNLTSDGTNSYVYDAENRLVSRSGGVSLSYDPNGRLWQVSAPSGTTRFTYDGDDLIWETDGAGNNLRAYAHGPGADEPLVWYEFAGGSSRRHLHADHQGSIVAAVDDGGNVVGVAGYDAWGIPNSTALTTVGRFGYTGQAWLPELGMWYYKARIYSPTLGRFLQTDPVGYKDQVNLYAYVGNDPVDHTDSTGECPLCGAAIGGGLEVAFQMVVEGKSLKEVDWVDVGISAAAGATGYGLVGTANKLLKAERAAARAENMIMRVRNGAGRAQGAARQARMAEQARRAQAALRQTTEAKVKVAATAAAIAAAKAGLKRATPPPEVQRKSKNEKN